MRNTGNIKSVTAASLQERSAWLAFSPRATVAPSFASLCFSRKAAGESVGRKEPLTRCGAKDGVCRCSSEMQRLNWSVGTFRVTKHTSAAREARRCNHCWKRSFNKRGNRIKTHHQLHHPQLQKKRKKSYHHLTIYCSQVISFLKTHTVTDLGWNDWVFSMTKDIKYYFHSRLWGRDECWKSDKVTWPARWDVPERSGFTAQIREMQRLQGAKLWVGNWGSRSRSSGTNRIVYVRHEQRVLTLSSSTTKVSRSTQLNRKKRK